MWQWKAFQSRRFTNLRVSSLALGLVGLAAACVEPSNIRSDWEEEGASDATTASNTYSGECELNACGGCARLKIEPGTACGPCNADAYRCAGKDEVECSGATITRDCRRCDPVGARLGERCGVEAQGTWTCTTEGVAVCASDVAMNTCGGEAELEAEPGDACGTCGMDRYKCNQHGQVTCSGDTRRNACGGCKLIEVTMGGACDGPDEDTCLDDVFVCEDDDHAICVTGKAPSSGDLTLLNEPSAEDTCDDGSED